MKKVYTSTLLLLLGAGLFTLVTWKWNVAAAAWLAPIFLIRFFRTQRRWITTLPAVFLLWAGSYANKTGAWEVEPIMEIILLGLAAAPMITALYLDRAAHQRLRPWLATLVFPAACVSLDYAISFLPLGTTFSIAPSQFYIEPLVQVAAVGGVWGIAFLVLWAAPVINAWWENGFDLRSVRIPAAVYAGCLVAALLAGGIRLVFTRPLSQTVRVAGVTVAHENAYWDEIIDLGTPEEVALQYAGEFQSLEDQLFVESENAARNGAKIIFWSEANAFIPPGGEDAFLQRASAFARKHQVYLMPAFEVLRYGDTSGYNGLAMITPQGETAYRYEKTMSWYATTSDGVIDSVDTPYGRIGAAICFDMDFPVLIRQAARQGVDIMLVPAFDTYETRTYHTEVGLLRGVEGGFSVMRMVNEGTSMAADYRGHVLAAQDFFTSPSRILIADLPSQGLGTPYALLGDWLAWLCIIYTVVMMFTSLYRPGKQASW